MQHRDCARRITAGFDFAAIGVEYPHGKVCLFGWLQHNQLIAADAAIPIGQAAHVFIAQFRNRILARVEHHEIIAEAVHLDEGNAHYAPASMRRSPSRKGRMVGTHRGYAGQCNLRQWLV